MRRFLLTLPLLLSIASNAFSQPTKQVCIPAVQAAKIADSLTVLPLVRREASAWQQAAGHFQSAGDSLRVAYVARGQAYQKLRGAMLDQQLLTANETAKAEGWRQCARRRGLLNYLLAAALAGSGYFILKP